MDIIFKQGLRKRNDFDKIVDYLQFHQEKIRYPDRTATNQLDELVDQLSFSDFYNAEKEMNQQKVFNMLMKADKQTQTKFFEDSGITFNINNFRDEYDKRLDSGDYYLAGGSSQNFNPQESDAQTMHLRLNKMKYLKAKIQTLAPYLFPSLPSLSSSTVLEPLPDNYVGPWDVAGYLGGGISDMLFAPFDYSHSPAVSEHPSSHISVSSASSAPPSSHPPISVHSSSHSVQYVQSSAPSSQSELPSPSDISICLILSALSERPFPGG